MAFCDSFVLSEEFWLCCVMLFWVSFEAGRKENAGHMHPSHWTEFERHEKICESCRLDDGEAFRVFSSC
jgi:hypothetical protein